MLLLNRRLWLSVTRQLHMDHRGARAEIIRLCSMSPFIAQVRNQRVRLTEVVWRALSLPHAVAGNNQPVPISWLLAARWALLVLSTAFILFQLLLGFSSSSSSKSTSDNKEQADDGVVVLTLCSFVASLVTFYGSALFVRRRYAALSAVHLCLEIVLIVTACALTLLVPFAFSSAASDRGWWLAVHTLYNTCTTLVGVPTCALTISAVVRVDDIVNRAYEESMECVVSSSSNNNNNNNNNNPNCIIRPGSVPTTERLLRLGALKEEEECNNYDDDDDGDEDETLALLTHVLIHNSSP